MRPRGRWRCCERKRSDKKHKSAGITSAPLSLTRIQIYELLQSLSFILFSCDAGALPQPPFRLHHLIFILPRRERGELGPAAGITAKEGMTGDDFKIMFRPPV